MAEESTYDAIQSLGASIDQFRVQSNANFGRMIGTQVDLISVIKSSEEKAYERSRDQFKQTDMSSAKNPAAGGGAAGVAAGATPKGGGGGILGKAMGGLGALAGVGIGLAGLGALFAGGGYLIKQLAEFDGKAVKENILELLTIAEDMPGEGALGKFGNLLGSGGTLLVLGGALIAFSAGAGMASAVEFFERPWAEDVKTNVLTLLSIAEAIPGDSILGKFGTVFGSGGTLVALGLGLGAFATGAGVAKAVDMMGADDFADKIKKQVETLLSIDTGSAIDIVTFPLKMGAIAGGLLAFAFGQAAASGAQAASATVDGGVAYFTNQENKGFAQNIKDDVETLMSILELPGVKKEGAVGSFVKTMAGIGFGLFAFSVGTATSTVASGAADAIAKFTTGDGSFSKKVYDDVDQLLKVTELSEGAGDEKTGKVKNFIGTMAGLAAGLAAFGAGTFVSTLGTAGAAVLSFLTGSESPFEQIVTIADKSDKIDKGATAIERLSIALNNISALKFDGSKMNMEDFAEDLVNAVPAIEAAIMGGKIDGGFFKSDVEYKGLASPDINFKEAAVNIQMIQDALNGISNVNAAAADAGGGGGTVVNNVNNVTNNGGGGDGGPNMNLQVTPMEESKRKSDSLYDYYGLDY